MCSRRTDNQDRPYGIIGVRGLASIFDEGSVALLIGHSPSHGLRRASPLREGAKAIQAGLLT